MLCDIAKKIDDEQLERIRELEQDLGLTIVAFSCRSLDPKREEKLQKIMDELGPQLQTAPDEPDDAQLDRIRQMEEAMGLSLVAVRPS
jgi:ribosome assembly protein YihI (activator of Der GTPase)